MVTDANYWNFEYTILLRNERHWGYHNMATKFWNTKSAVTCHKDLPTKTFIMKLNKETLFIWKNGKFFWQCNSFYSLPSSLNGRFKRKKMKSCDSLSQKTAFKWITWGKNRSNAFVTYAISIALHIYCRWC